MSARAAAAAPGRPSPLPHIDYAGRSCPRLSCSAGPSLLLGVASLVRQHRCGVASPPIATVGRLGAARWSSSLVAVVRRAATHGPAHVRSTRSVAVDGFSVFVVVLVSLRRAVVARWWPTATCAARDGRARVPRARPVSASGAMFMATANDLIVVFLGLEILSIALYVLAAFERRAGPSRGGGAQVLHARRRSPRRSSSTASPSSTAPPGRPTCPRSPTSWPRTSSLHQRAAPGRHGAAARRLRLQGGGRAVPHVDPRRLPGRPDARRPGSWPPWPRRAASPPCCGSSSPPSATLRTDWQPVVWVLAVLTLVARRRRGPRPARRQADARLLLDQPRRLRPPRGAGGDGPGRRGVALLPVRLHVHGASGSFAVVTVRRAARATRDHDLDALPGPGGASRCWPWPSPCSCWPRPASRSRPGSWPSWRWSAAAWRPVDVPWR